VGPLGVTKQLGRAVEGKGERGEAGRVVIRYYKQIMRGRRV